MVDTWYRFCDKDCELEHMETIYPEEADVSNYETVENESNDVSTEGETVESVEEGASPEVEIVNSSSLPEEALSIESADNAEIDTIE
jgi:hypothetical protein